MPAAALLRQSRGMSTTFTTPPRPTRPRTLRTLKAAAAVLALGGMAALLAGGALVLEDLASRGEMFDGLGLALGLTLVVPGLLLLVLAGLALWFMGRRPALVAGVLCAVGMVLALAGFALTATTGVLVAAPVALGGLLVAGLSLTTALGLPAWR
jgi:hypothetical protein